MSLPPSVSSRASLNRWPTIISAIAAPKMAVLNILHFAGSVVGIVPERHVASVCMRVPKRHTSCGAAQQTPRLLANRSRQRKYCEPCGDNTARFFFAFCADLSDFERTENIERIERAKKKYLYARVKAIRLRAEMAFLAAGGARGDFAREWLPVFLEELCGADASAAASG
jgi:hypothetical protein